MSQTEPFLQARIQRLDDAEESAAGLEGEALLRSVKEGLERAQQLGKNISAEVMTVATNLISMTPDGWPISPPPTSSSRSRKPSKCSRRWRRRSA
jgi:hypothetical protein